MTTIDNATASGPRAIGSTVLAPGSREANDNLRAWLREFGDHGGAPRRVLHYAYPRNAAAAPARDALAAELRRRGFAVGDAALRHGLVFQHDAIVASQRFDALTTAIAMLLAAADWDYDAWECGPQADSALAYWRKLEQLALH